MAKHAEVLCLLSTCKYDQTLYTYIILFCTCIDIVLSIEIYVYWTNGKTRRGPVLAFNLQSTTKHSI